MTIPMSEKEKMLTMLTEIYDQLEELESVLEASFSDERLQIKSEEQEKLTVTLQCLSDIEGRSAKMNPMPHQEILDTNLGTIPPSLKLELGF
jgi:predicted ribonuclease YlaK